MADCILLAVARKDTFFSQKIDALENPGICPKVKLLMGLKSIVYGMLPHQLPNCMKRLLARGISTSEALRSVFLHSMTRADARRV
jgi:hypothetical protein